MRFYFFLEHYSPPGLAHTVGAVEYIGIPDRVLPMGQIELFDILTEYKQMTYVELNCSK